MSLDTNIKPYMFIMFDNAILFSSMVQSKTALEFNGEAPRTAKRSSSGGRTACCGI